MSSGFGNRGGISRCYPYWQDVMACYVLNTTKDSDMAKFKCAGIREDYYECLHHTKELEKVQQINEAIRRYERGLGSVRDESAMTSLGLIKNSYSPNKKDLY